MRDTVPAGGEPVWLLVLTLHSQADGVLARARTALSCLSCTQPGFPEAGSEAELACRVFLRGWPLSQGLWARSQGLAEGSPAGMPTHPPCQALGALEPELLSGAIPCRTSLLSDPWP